MKKIISACLISTMIVVPCASYASADPSTECPATPFAEFFAEPSTESPAESFVESFVKSSTESPATPFVESSTKSSAAFPFNFFFKELKKECADVYLCKKVWDHPIFSAVGIFAALHVADKAFSAVKERIDTNLGYRIPKYKGGYTHKEEKGEIGYSLPNITYENGYTSPKFTSNPASDNACNVYYSTTGKIQLKLDEKQKEHFSDRGYVSVKLRDIPQKKVGKFKKPLIWLYKKLKNEDPQEFNKFYIHGPNLPKPTFVDYLKQFLPFVHSPKVSFLSCLEHSLPWNEKDFIKINYGIVLTNKDEEAVLNFKAPTTSDYTKEYLEQKKINDAHKNEKLEPYEYDCIEDVTTYNKNGTSVKTVTKKKANSPLSTIQKYYTAEDIKKLKDENDKKKAVVLAKLANACQDNYITNGEIARLSLQNPEKTFRLVINNANGAYDADQLSALLNKASQEQITTDGNNPQLLFDFEYVLPLPDRLKSSSEAKLPHATKIMKEVNSIEPSVKSSKNETEIEPNKEEKDPKKTGAPTTGNGSPNSDTKKSDPTNSGAPAQTQVTINVNDNTGKQNKNKNKNKNRSKK